MRRLFQAAFQLLAALRIYTNMASSADLFEDDNSVIGTARLEDIAEITADNYSVTEIKNYDTFAQDDKIILPTATNKALT